MSSNSLRRWFSAESKNEPSKRYELPTTLVGGIPMVSKDHSKHFRELIERRMSAPASERMIFTGTPNHETLSIAEIRERIAALSTVEVDWADMIHATAYSELTKRSDLTGHWDPRPFDASKIDVPKRPSSLNNDKPQTQIESDWI